MKLFALFAAVFVGLAVSTANILRPSTAGISVMPAIPFRGEDNVIAEPAEYSLRNSH